MRFQASAKGGGGWGGGSLNERGAPGEHALDGVFIDELELRTGKRNRRRGRDQRNQSRPGSRIAQRHGAAIPR